jgi:hypothetical protein
LALGLDFLGSDLSPICIVLLWIGIGAIEEETGRKRESIAKSAEGAGLDRYSRTNSKSGFLSVQKLQHYLTFETLLLHFRKLSSQGHTKEGCPLLHVKSYEGEHQVHGILKNKLIQDPYHNFLLRLRGSSGFAEALVVLLPETELTSLPESAASTTESEESAAEFETAELLKPLKAKEFWKVGAIGEKEGAPRVAFTPAKRIRAGTATDRKFVIVELAPKSQSKSCFNSKEYRHQGSHRFTKAGT